MSARPTFIAPIRTDPEGYAAQNPVSSWRALAMRNNLQYWVDLCTQHRINWVAAATDITVSGSAWHDAFWFQNPSEVGARSALWASEFVHTWIRGDYPTGLDIVIAGFILDTGDDIDIIARIVPATAAFNDPGATALWETTATASGPNGVALIDEQVFFNEAIESTGMFLEHSIDEGGTIFKPRQALLRLEVLVTVPLDGDGGIDEVLVREFACQS